MIAPTTEVAQPTGPETGKSPLQIGLALSGGGVRAAVFHLGVLRRLAEDDLLESVAQVSTVSGGSLVTAAVISAANHRWPDSPEFLNKIYPKLRQMLTTKDLFNHRALGWGGLIRSNVDLFNHRANVLAGLLERQWGVRGRLQDLPETPAWWINTTCVETGKNWRFSKREMGDWQFGKHYSPSFRIAEAAAASAAVPYIIGALHLQLPKDGWYKTNPLTKAPLERQPPPSDHVHLWDGGAYENLGLEVLFKPQIGLIGCDYLICSDASGPLPPSVKFSPLDILKGHLASPRLFDISADQIRALRSRMLMSAIDAGTVRGALLRMGNSVRDVDIKSGRQRSAESYDGFQLDQETALALQYPTDLAKLSELLFDRIARHGYEIADATLTAYSPAEFPRSVAWPGAPGLT